ncbi:deoxyribodipyrimidine photo-lyase/cryptochrome family protein [Halorubrum sp. ASP1]|jgi:deoxyribodipyrimidine photo-lyase|uniref:cryptochrome/deoxyribodipyrimidine photo-lyase family protein n=1 Tax=Halorubrum TaxID=56688 RepID=UPI0009E8D9F0|nr:MULTISPECIES: cryptochrome/deoxyribodipyrimidine photo-lyase family protein [Halorubrum]TKX59793.1 deoxyribodipyrimidine photo-lyase/cryptochrome family protein [Halorubrum sp. ASP1]
MPGDTERETERSASVDSDELSQPTSPLSADIPTPDAVCDAANPTGIVVWHRKHLRVEDQLAVSRAVADGDVFCPLFVFDPTFYADSGLACDARVRLFEEAVTSLDRLYAAAPPNATHVAATDSAARLADTLDSSPPTTEAVSEQPETLQRPDAPGLTLGYGDPVDILSRFVDRGWHIITMATPTSRYGQRRDERVRDVCGDAVTFVSGDGLVRDEEWPRSNWQTQITEWLAADQHTPGWDDHNTVRVSIRTGVTPAAVDRHFDVSPAKTQVPVGTHRAAMTTLREFTDRVRSYPSNISAPQDARDGTSGLSPYLNFGLLSVRQAHQYVADNAPSCRGADMFESRLVWNLHYSQKLVDWPGWTEQAVNPAFENRNEAFHDPELVTAWKRGQTGFPMVDASMRCLKETGWLNFRMRAMCASFFTHVLHQPWWIGADWYHHHLIDSDVGINYTQWQSQAGLIGKPSQRVYNPRKQVRDQDPDGDWITRWIPELADLPSEFLDQPEKAPLAVQQECGVHVGEVYPRPVVDFEARREQFWSRYEAQRPEAARELRRPAIAKRASFSGGYSAARAIADKHGTVEADAPDGTQASLGDLADTDTATAETEGAAATPPQTNTAEPVNPTVTDPRESSTQTTIPTGAGRNAGEPSPDDRAAVSGQRRDSEEGAERDEERDVRSTGQTRFGDFE